MYALCAEEEARARFAIERLDSYQNAPVKDGTCCVAPYGDAVRAPDIFYRRRSGRVMANAEGARRVERFNKRGKDDRSARTQNMEWKGDAMRFSQQSNQKLTETRLSRVGFTASHLILMPYA